MFDHQPRIIASFAATNSTNSNNDAYQKFIENLANKTLALAEQLTQDWAYKAINEQVKVSNCRKKRKNVLLHDQKMQALEDRTQQFIERMQYDTEQKQRIIRGQP